MTLHTGDAAPDFSLPAGDGKQVLLKNLRGRWVVLYFYPKDNTPGCTQEACDFRDLKAGIAKKNAVVLGVSKDNIKSHQNFAAEFGLNFTLLSDPEGKTCQDYGVFKKKSMFGKSFLGILRSTFLIDPAGKIAKIWQPVTVKGHAEEVLKTIL